MCVARPWPVGQVNAKVSAGNPRRLYGINGYACVHTSIYKVAGLFDYYRQDIKCCYCLYILFTSIYELLSTADLISKARCTLSLLHEQHGTTIG